MSDLLRLFLLCVLLSNCNNKSEAQSNCSSNNPLESLPWLKQITSDFKQVKAAPQQDIYQYTYNNNTVFLVNDCNNCSDKLSVVYNCSGDVICEFGGFAGANTCPDFEQTATNKTLLWTNTNPLIIDSNLYNTTTPSNYTISAVTITNNKLNITITSGGCNGESWSSKLIASEEVAESFPVQRFIKLELTNTERCKALITKDMSFNISDLKVDGNTSIMLNLNHWTDPVLFKY